MADVKQSFIDALNTTPDGIDAFLETPIPTVAAFAMPTDVDSSIIAQGKLAYNINEILRAFGGLTPIELLLRIGQHNSVLQGALLAGLEYIEQEGYEFTIVSPTPTGIYSPTQEIQFAADLETQEDFNKCSGIVVEVIVPPTQNEGQLTQQITLERIGDQQAYVKNIVLTMPTVYNLPITLTARFSASFEGVDVPYTKTVTFTLSENV